MRDGHVPLCSLENKRPLAHFDIIGFSLLYELNYTNVLNMLDLAGIPLKSCDRKPEDPFIIAGGPCVCNPEPMADFFDAMIFGDGETVIQQNCQISGFNGKRRGPETNKNCWRNGLKMKVSIFLNSIRYDTMKTVFSR